LSIELGNFALLAVIKTLGPAELLTLPLGALDTLICALADST
jgi:hypothetical protein